MTREEQIKKAAEAINIKIISNPWTLFEKGAEWADAHPKQIEISLEDIEELAKEVVPDDLVKRQDTLWEMIRRNQRAQFITKACEWLEKNIADIWNSPCNPEKIVEQFRKVMNED